MTKCDITSKWDRIWFRFRLQWCEWASKTCSHRATQVTLKGSTFDLFGGHSDGQNGLHKYFARQRNGIRDPVCSLWTGLKCEWRLTDSMQSVALAVVSFLDFQSGQKGSRESNTMAALKDQYISTKSYCKLDIRKCISPLTPSKQRLQMWSTMRRPIWLV